VIRLVIHRLGKDIPGSIGIRLAWLKEERLQASRIRLNPLDCVLAIWPYGWPPVMADETVPRMRAFIDIAPPGQLALPL
jgi:hypothetical protein